MIRRLAAVTFLVAFGALSSARAQAVVPRPMRVTFEGCAPRVERVVVGDLSRPERSRVRLVTRDENDVWRAHVRCEGARVAVRVRSPRGQYAQTQLRGIDPHDLREVLLAPVESARDEAPGDIATPPPEDASVALPARPEATPEATRARRWALTLGLTARAGTGAQPYFGGVAVGVRYLGDSGIGLRTELTGELGGANDAQLGDVSLALGGVGVMVERHWKRARVTPSAGIGVRGGIARVREEGARAREGVMPWGGAVLRAGASIAVRGAWGVYVGVEGGAAVLSSAVRVDERTIASVGPLWGGVVIAVEVSP